MVGFVEELEEEPQPTQPPHAAAAQAARGVPGPKGARRMQQWVATARERECRHRMLRRYFEGWWSTTLRHRPARLQARADDFLLSVNTSLSRPYYAVFAGLRQKKLLEAEAAKKRGNEHFASGNIEEAIAMYTEALRTAPKSADEVAAYHANRAACFLKEENWREVEKDCTAALKRKPEYEKALLRRMVACEALGEDDLYKALEDAEKLVKLQPHNAQARGTAARLAPLVEARKKQQMDEAMESLKGIGNSVLGYFGMSLDNFKTTQNPDGTYGVSFQQ